MWSDTALIHLMGITYPIIQAPMRGITTPEMVAAVSNSGCLGTLPADFLTPKELKKNIRKVKKLTSLPFAVHVFAHLMPEISDVRKQAMYKVLSPVYQQLNLKQKRSPKIPGIQLTKLLETIINEKVPIVSFSCGALEPAWVERLKAQNILLIGSASCKEEAKLLQDMHCDAIVLQGLEASGERVTFIGRDEDFLYPLDRLVSDCNAIISKPLIASGGIMEGEDVKKCLQLGASGVQLGTAFIASEESAASPIHKKILQNPHDLQTILSRSYSGKLSRILPNSLTDYLDKYIFQILEFPIQHYYTLEISSFSRQLNDPSFCELRAGLHFEKCKVGPIKKLLEELIDEINR